MACSNFSVTACDVFFGGRVRRGIFSSRRASRRWRGGRSSSARAPPSLHRIWDSSYAIDAPTRRHARQGRRGLGRLAAELAQGRCVCSDYLKLSYFNNYDNSGERKHRGVRFCAARKSYRDVGSASGGRSGGHMRDAPGGPSPTGHSSVQLAAMSEFTVFHARSKTCLLYTSPSPRDQRGSRMPSSA